jgi:Flp pilus assembly protein TadG
MERHSDDDAELGPVKTRTLTFRLRLPRRWRRSEDGAAAIEFAIVAPVFFFLMFVIAETALVFIAEQVMDNAVFEAARLVRTGQVQLAGWTDDEFRDEVCDRMSVFVDCEGDFFLEVKSYDNFAEMNDNLDDPVDEEDAFDDETSFDFGTPNDIVIVRAYYQWPINPIMGMQWKNAMSNGKRLIGSFAAFCNEPYGSAASGCN